MPTNNNTINTIWVQTNQNSQFGAIDPSVPPSKPPLHRTHNDGQSCQRGAKRSRHRGPANDTTILRKHAKVGFTIVNNDLFLVEGMSYRAVGVATFLLSKPDNWKITIGYLASRGKEGEKAIRAALQELAVYGYLMRERVYIDGQITTVTHLADYPAFLNCGTAQERINGYKAKSPEVASPITDLPFFDRSVIGDVGKGDVVVKTDSPITEEIRTEKERRVAAKPPSVRPSLPEEPLPGEAQNPLLTAYSDLIDRPLGDEQVKQILCAAPPQADWLVALRVWKLADHNPTNITGILELAADPKRARWKLAQLEAKNAPEPSYQPPAEVQPEPVTEDKLPAHTEATSDAATNQPTHQPSLKATQKPTPEQMLFDCVEEKWPRIAAPGQRRISLAERDEVRQIMRVGNPKAVYAALRAVIDQAEQFDEVLAVCRTLRAELGASRESNSHPGSSHR